MHKVLPLYRVYSWSCTNITSLSAQHQGKIAGISRLEVFSEHEIRCHDGDPMMYNLKTQRRRASSGMLRGEGL
jgi:hypothetical protein